MVTLIKESKIFNVAHRGSSGTYPENTRSAFLEAIKHNADVIELDVQLTKDKQIIVHHDYTIFKNTGRLRRVTKMTLKELKRYNFGTKKNKEQILTLKEALDIIDNKSRVIVEAKKTVENYEHLLNKEIENCYYKKNVWVHSKHWKIIKNLRKINQTLRIGYIDLFPAFHLFSFGFHLPLAKKNNVTFFSLKDPLFNKFLIGGCIERLRRKNIESYVWTINSLRRMRKFFTWRANAIITNYPSRFNEFVGEGKKKV
jgi:glycerophosphoryl diester phosphodiesterase